MPYGQSTISGYCTKSVSLLPNLYINAVQLPSTQYPVPNISKNLNLIRIQYLKLTSRRAGNIQFSQIVVVNNDSLAEMENDFHVETDRVTFVIYLIMHY